MREYGRCALHPAPVAFDQGTDTIIGLMCAFTTVVYSTGHQTYSAPQQFRAAYLPPSGATKVAHCRDSKQSSKFHVIRVKWRPPVRNMKRAQTAYRLATSKCSDVGVFITGFVSHSKYLMCIRSTARVRRVIRAPVNARRLARGIMNSTRRAQTFRVTSRHTNVA